MSFDPNHISGLQEDLMENNLFGNSNSLLDNEDSIDISGLISEPEFGQESSFLDLNNIESEFKEDPDLNSLFGETLKQEPDYTSCLPTHIKAEPYFNPQVQNEFGTSSVCASACSSAAPSPVPFHHYQTFHSPNSVASQSSERSLLRKHLQFNVRAPANPIMSNNQFNSHPDAIELNGSSFDDHSVGLNLVTGKRTIKTEPHTNGTFDPIKQENGYEGPLSLVRQKRQQQNHLDNDDTVPKKSKIVIKGTDEYKQKRERNNVAVRRSRDKAKKKAQETQNKVQCLTEENQHLKDKVNKLQLEIETLRGLLSSVTQQHHILKK